MKKKTFFESCYSKNFWFCRAKNIKASPFVDEKSLSRLLEKLSAHTEFRTLNKGN